MAAVLTPAQIAALTPIQIAALSPAQIAALTPAQIHRLRVLPAAGTLSWEAMTAQQKRFYRRLFITRPPMPRTMFPSVAQHWTGGLLLGRNGRLLGQGGQAPACLWLEQSAAGNILQRIVVKENQLDAAEYANLDNYVVHPPGGRRKYPREYFNQLASTRNPPGAANAAAPPVRDHIVQPLGYQLVPKRKSHRVYTEFGTNPSPCLLEIHSLPDGNIS